MCKAVVAAAGDKPADDFGLHRAAAGNEARQKASSASGIPYRSFGMICLYMLLGLGVVAAIVVFVIPWGGCNCKCKGSSSGGDGSAPTVKKGCDLEWSDGPLAPPHANLTNITLAQLNMTQ